MQQCLLEKRGFLAVRYQINASPACRTTVHTVPTILNTILYRPQNRQNNRRKKLVNKKNKARTAEILNSRRGLK
jgi:hypothetical protein